MGSARRRKERSAMSARDDDPRHHPPLARRHRRGATAASAASRTASAARAARASIPARGQVAARRAARAVQGAGRGDARRPSTRWPRPPTCPPPSPITCATTTCRPRLRMGGDPRLAAMPWARRRTLETQHRPQRRARSRRRQPCVRRRGGNRDAGAGLGRDNPDDAELPA